MRNTSQCQGGSPRFDIVTTTGTFFLGCNNVTPTINANGTATYTFTAATIAAAGNQVAFPTGTITAIDVLIENFTNPAFKNQGDCVRFVATGGKNPPNG